MCITTTESCPYPYQESIAAIILGKGHDWLECDRSKPWGKLSCGALEVHHSIPYHRAAASYSSSLHHARKPDLVYTSISAQSKPTNTDSKPAESGYVDSTLCEWCTAVINKNAYKAHEEDANKKIKRLEEAMDADKSLRDLDVEIVEMESKLATLKADAWLQRKAAMKKVEP